MASRCAFEALLHAVKQQLYSKENALNLSMSFSVFYENELGAARLELWLELQLAVGEKVAAASALPCLSTLL